jgi:O-succinylbenzoate synthase
VELWWIRLPLVAPFVTSHGTETERQVVLVQVRDHDGHEGWGEVSTLSAPTYTAEHTAGAWDLLRSDLAPRLLEGLPLDAPGAPMARAGLVTALEDLRLRREGRSLAAALGATRDRVATAAVLGRQDGVDALVEVAAQRVAEGAHLVKCKIAPGWDLEPLRALRTTYPALALAADANGAYGLDDLDRLRRLDGLALSYLEQPCPADDLEASGRVARALATPVALDESIGAAADLDAALARGALAVVNVKPARLGSADSAARLARRAAAAGLAVFVGGMLETGVGRGVALAVAGLAACGLPTDVGPSARYVARDVTEPWSAEPDGWMVVPREPGATRHPLPDRLRDATIAHEVLHR